MLVLSRKPGDKIIIGDDVEIVVTGFRSGSVRIGIKAPKHISIRRAELPVIPSGEAQFELAASGT